MILNISQLLEYQYCPVSWHNKFIQGRAPEGGAAFADGTYWHKLAECWLKGDPLLPPAMNPTQDVMRHFVEEGNLPKLPVSHVELELRMPLGRHTLIGILDGILPTGGGHYSLQWKTCAGGQDLERQCDAVKYSYHEVAYEALMNANGFPCKGTYLGVWKKLTKPEREKGMNPLTFHILEREPEYVTKVLNEIEHWATDMELHQYGYRRPNRKNCIQGFNRCKFFDTCYNGVPLSDERYTDYVSRYEETK